METIYMGKHPEELDQKTCAASEKNQKETFNYAGKISIYKRSELRLNQKIRNDRTNFPVIFNENCNRTGSCR